MYRYQARHQITQNVDREVFKGTVTAMSGNNIQSNDFTKYPDDAFNDAEIYFYSGTAIGQSRTVSDFASASGQFNPNAAFSPQAVAGDLFEVHPHGRPQVTHINDAIDMAYMDAEDVFLVDKIDETLTAQAGRFEFPIPSGFRFLSGVKMDTRRFSGSLWGSDKLDSFQSLNTAANNNAKLSQAFKVTSNLIPGGIWIDSIRLYLRKRGTISPPKTMTVRIETDSSGSPSGTLLVTHATITLTTAYVVVTPGYCDFALASSVLIPLDTTYHIVLSIDGAVDTTNFIEWGRDTDTAYGNGYACRYDSVGLAWTQQHTQTNLFTLGNSQISAQFEDVPPLYWRVVPSSKLLVIDSPIEGATIRLIGQGQATTLTADTDSLALPENFVIAKASALLLNTYASGPQKDTEAALTRASYFEAMVEKYRARMSTPLRANSKRVESR